MYFLPFWSPFDLLCFFGGLMLAAGTDEAGVDLATLVSPSSVISCPVALFNPQPHSPPASPHGKISWK